ncbi:uncharacterized protein RJT20DRAFT_7189 [Scheffersomyces xylosifermentans]|uniref:uncharacterized protein n=1 Tax=Scheffersomyces xylosifermentans TaxID=1304137 RepID=UPI00315DDBC6
MSDIELDIEKILSPPLAQPLPTILGSKTPTQRKSSNFFPLVTPGEQDENYDSPRFMNTPHLTSFQESNPHSYTKRHNSSPMIGAFNNRANSSGGPSNNTSKFFSMSSASNSTNGTGNGNMNGNGNNGELLTPFLGEIMPTSTTTTTTSTSTTSGVNQSISLFGGIDIGADLSNNLNNLHLLSPPPSGYRYSQSTPQSATVPNVGFVSMSSPPTSSASMLNLGGVGPSTTTTTSGSATPSLSATSIWNDSNPGNHFGNGNIFNSTPKLSTLEELLDNENQLQQSRLDSLTTLNDPYNNEVLFSPFYSNKFSSSTSAVFTSNLMPATFTDVTSPTNSRPTSFSAGASAAKLQPKARENLYSSKLNTPSFVPSAFLSDSSSSTPLKATESEQKLESTRAFIKQTHARPGKYSGHFINNDSAILESKLNHIEKREIEISSKFHKGSGLPSLTAPTVATPPVVDRSNVKVNLNFSKTRDNQVTRSDQFVRDILATDATSKYGEDYCSTFYKRNSHGYMFIKEPTNTLKVNTTANKSWVQLKIKLPCNEARNRTESPTLLVKKLKVDVRHLPIWRPITLNSGTNSYSQGSYNFNSNHQGGKRYNGNNYSGYGSNSRRYSGGGSTNGYGNGKDFRKPKNLNVSKRFGKKSLE